MGKYTEQAKLAAVEDYCTGHHGLKIVAQRHGVNVESLRRWAALYRVHGAKGVQEKRKAAYEADIHAASLKVMELNSAILTDTAAIADAWKGAA